MQNRTLVLLLALLVAIIYTACVHAARDVNLCRTDLTDCRCDGNRGAAVTTLSSSSDDDQATGTLATTFNAATEDEEVVLEAIVESDEADENVATQSSPPVNPQIISVFQNMFQSLSTLFKLNCVTSCEWFGENEPFCSNCTRPMIVYPRDPKANTPCFTLPNDISNGKVSLDAVNDIKGKCITLGGCTCTPNKITNALTVRLLRRAVLETTKEYIDIVRRNVTEVAKRVVNDPKCIQMVSLWSDEANKKMSELEQKELIECEKIAPTIKNDSEYRNYLQQVYKRVQDMSVEIVATVSKKLSDAKCFKIQQVVDTAKDAVKNGLSSIFKK